MDDPTRLIVPPAYRPVIRRAWRSAMGRERIAGKVRISLRVIGEIFLYA